eukprot:gene9438-biopygen8266
MEGSMVRLWVRWYHARTPPPDARSPVSPTTTPPTSSADPLGTGSGGTIAVPRIGTQIDITSFSRRFHVVSTSFPRRSLVST